MSYLSFIADSDLRKTYILPADTEIQSDEGIFRITDKPVHCGGNAILYFAHKEGSDIDFVLKEYFPYNGYLRRNGIVVPYAFLSATSDERNALRAVESEIQATVQAEEQQSQLIYRYTSRVAVNRSALHVSRIVCPDGTTYAEPEGVNDPWHFLLLDDLSQKGVFLTDIIAEAAYPHSDEHPLGNYEPRPILGNPLPILDINVTLKIVSSVLEVLARIHEEAHFIHSDIQPNNIFFEGADLKRGIVGHAMFLDFGSAHRLQANGSTEPLLMTEVTGTPAYAPPELYSEQDISLTPAADIYSVGRLFLALIKPRTAISSYGATTSPNISYSQLRIKPGEERASHCSPTLAKSINAILKKALEPDPELRYQSAREMLEAIEELTPQYSLPEGLSTPEFFIEHSRDADLDRLDDALESGMKPVWIWGFGGIGKTELAMEFGRKCKQKNYTVSVFRFHDSIQQTILDLQISGYQYRAPEGLNENELPHAQFEDRLRVLNSMGPDTVLIMDNFDLESARYSEMLASPDFKMLCDILPKLVITTRYNLFQRYPQFEVKPLEPQMLLQLFDHGLQVSNDVLLEIIHAVGCHTMTVALIAKAMNDILFPMNPELLLQALKDSDISKVPDAIVTDKDRSYQEKTIYGHLKIVFDLSQLSGDEKTVLKYSMLISFARGSGLDLELFSALLSSTEKIAFRRLFDHGWISRTREKYLYVHPLIRELCEHELCPKELDFNEFLSCLKEPHAMHLIGDFSRLERNTDFFIAICYYSSHAKWDSWDFWSSLAFAWMDLDVLAKHRDYFVRSKYDLMKITEDFLQFFSYIDRYDIFDAIKREPILCVWLLEYISLPISATLQAEENCYDGQYDNAIIFRKDYKDSIADRELALAMSNQIPDNEAASLISTLILHELAICYALDSKLYTANKVIDGFQTIIDFLIEKKQEKGSHDYLVLQSYEYFNLAHFLAQQDDCNMRLQANAYYEQALDIQLHVDEKCSNCFLTIIKTIRDEYDFYLQNGYVNRGTNEFLRQGIEVEIAKLEMSNVTDCVDDNEQRNKYNNQVHLLKEQEFLKYLTDSSASDYQIQKQKKIIESYQMALSKRIVSPEE